MPDPAAIHGTAEEMRAAFRSAAITLKRRIELMARLAAVDPRFDGIRARAS
jgi:hypothetical protein